MATMQDLMKAIQDPQQKEMLATKAAAKGPPPELPTEGMPNVPGVTPPPAPNPQLQSGLAGIGAQPQGQPQGQGQGADNPEENKSKWMEFMDNISDPNGPALPLLQMGAELLQPRTGGQTQGGAIGAAGANFAKNMAQQRLQEREAARQGEKDEAEINLAEAQTEKLGAETGKTERDIESASVMDDLAAAKAELARAKAGAEGAGSSKDIIFDTTAQALLRSYPEKYKNLDEARVALRTFEITKGNTNEAKAVTQLMENLPYMDEDRVQPTLDLINETLSGTDMPPPGATAERQGDLQAQAENLRTRVPLDTIPPEDWLKFETTLKEQRKVAEMAYGKEVVEQKIREAKANQ